ncbi:MAG: aminotransferase class I/II-fold pyridoxal phosphate-dependent enzyme, partial [Micropepsaceae bacterium]
IAGDKELCARPLAHARAFAAAAGLGAPQSAIVPVVLGASSVALEASAMLERKGFLVTAIRPPTVPDGTARLRITFCANHVRDDVMRLADAVRSEILPMRAVR